MRRDKDEIEDLFGTALSNLEISPTEEMEARLMAAIDFVQPKKRRGLFWLWMGGLMTVALGLVLSTLLFDLNPTQRLHLNQNTAPKNKIQTFTTIENKSIIQSVVLTTTDNLSTQHQPYSQTFIKSDDQLIKKENLMPKKMDSIGRLDSIKNIDVVTIRPGEALNLEKINTTNLDQDTIKIIPTETDFTAADTVNQEKAGQDSTLTKVPPTPSSLLSVNEDDDSEAVDQSNNHNEDKLKNKLSLSYKLAFPKQQNTTIPRTDSTWSINRGLLNATEFNFTHLWAQHFTFSSGIRLERSQENWISTFQKDGLITKDTIIGGEPAVITYFGSIKYASNRTYKLTQLSLPLSLGYSMRFGKFILGLEVGGLINLNFIKEHTTLLNNAIANSTKRETIFSFTPQSKLNLDYLWGRAGMGIILNYELQNLNRSSLLEQALNRNNIGFGLRFLYTF